MVEYSISVYGDGHDLIPEGEPYHCHYLHVDDLVVVVLVVARSSDFDQPHSRNLLNNPPPLHQRQEPQKYQQQHQLFSQDQEGHDSLVGGLFHDVEVVVVVVVVVAEVRQVQPVVVVEDAQVVH